MTGNLRRIKEVDQYIEGLAEEIQTLTSELRKIILDVSPEVIEEYKWSMPNYSYKGLICYLQASKKHVNLGFQKGYLLEEMDNNDLLEGSGKTMRHIKIKKIEDIQPEVFKSYIKEAMKLNEK